VEIGLVRKAEEETVHRLVEEVFWDQVAPDFSPQGCDSFLEFVEAQRGKWDSRDTVAVVARWRDRPVGVILLREPGHIQLFFVKRDWQNKGVGRLLLSAAVRLVKERMPRASMLSVNAAPGSVQAYAAMGFTSGTGGELEVDGVVHTPMYLSLR
jgi:GNAT superfamily N-acetyltransferase